MRLPTSLQTPGPPVNPWPVRHRPAALRPARLPLVSLVLLGWLTGCRGCRNDHPFVPYRIAADAPAPSSVVGIDASPPPVDTGASMRELAVVAPAHATTWTVGNVTLTAPPAGTFRQALAWDLDGDGHQDALALVEEVDEAVHEALFFFRGTAGGVAAAEDVPLLATAHPLALDTRCARIEHLVRVGRRSASVEVGQSCPREVAETGPDRVVALVAWSDALRTRLVLPVVDPPGGQALALEMDGADVDGDGLDDVTLRVSLEGGEPPFEPGPAVHTVFRWFDRPAGMSRDPGEPSTSLAAVAALAAQRAVRPKEAASAGALAAAGRFLFQAVCAESSARRVVPSPASSPLSCGAGHALEELGLAATRAYVTQGDALRAIAALDAAELPPAAHTSTRAADASGWLAAIAPVVQATEVRAISAVPRLGPEASSWGALRFEPTGSLLVRTLAGVVRVDPVHGDEVDAAGVMAWGTKVASPDGNVRFDGVFARCRSVALQATLVASEGVATDGGDATAVALPVAAPMAVRCGPGDRDAVPVIPVAWGPGGLELVVAGEPVLVAPGAAKASPLFQLLGQPVTPGAPRSPDGATLVVPTSQGILVRGQKTRLLRARELEHGYKEVRDCAVSDDAARVACVRGGAAFVGVWPAP